MVAMRCFAVVLVAMPLGRLTIQPSYAPMFRLEMARLMWRTPELVGWLELFAKPIAFKDEIDGYRFAPPSLRAVPT